jgi:hypothetical protein
MRARLVVVNQIMQEFFLEVLFTLEIGAFDQVFIESSQKRSTLPFVWGR